MTIDGSGEWFPMPDEEHSSPQAGAGSPDRLDSILPTDTETGVATYEALRTYLGALIDLMARHGQPLTLLTISADPNDALRILGARGAQLISGAIARCLRQETRVHDVIGRARTECVPGVPSFLVVLPLMKEALATQFADRLREAMTITAGDDCGPWLTMSVGVASLSLDTDAPDTLILRAQEALSSAQRAGGGRVWSHADSVRRIVERHQPDSSLD
jgi:GGDEF domain-containing protein